MLLMIGRIAARDVAVLTFLVDCFRKRKGGEEKENEQVPPHWKVCAKCLALT
jgi:hypothetical protein